jgi:HSP20 family protein
MFELTTWPRSPWSIFDELEALQDGMNRALDGRSGRRADERRYRYPLMNVWTSEDGLVVDAELPGANPEDVDISVMADELTISGKINSLLKRENETLHRQERPSGEFSRTLQLPFRANSEGVRAAFKNGILRVSIPRSEEEKPRKIRIEAA